MIQLQNVDVFLGGHPILQDVSWALPPQEMIGLVGRNGAGKSTLLRVLAGNLQPDGGRLSLGNASVGYLSQDVHETDTGRSVRDEALSAFEEVLALEREEEELLQKLEETDAEGDGYEKVLHRLEQVHSRLHILEARTIHTRADAVLTGLGFDPDSLDQPLATFSGGWRMRAVLARLLLRRPDLLLLDEPTNHLDLAAIDWLEAYLRDYSGTVILVSHDRRFLDRMVGLTAELSQQQLTLYHGNYSHYLEARKERREQQRAAYENQQREIKHTERFIERFRYKASKAAQVQSRVKQLEKMERIPPPPSEEATIGFEFPPPPRSGRVVLRLSSFSKTYQSDDGPTHVFTDADPLVIERGDKIALVGKNGAGKSTLARILRGIEPFEGTRELGHNVTCSYFAQHQADTLNPAHTIYESLREQAPDRGETELRTLAGAFLFTGEDVFKTISVLSGGEKSRVALARALLEPANFLILDEPTNHLDLQSIDVLIEALQSYQGTFLVVSHDRHFLGKVASRVWRAGGGDVRDYPGTFEEYRWKMQQLAEKESAAAESSDGNNRGKGGSGSAAGGGSGSASSGGAGSASSGAASETASGAASNGAGAAKGGSDGRFSDLNPYQLRRAYDEKETAIFEKEARKSELEAALADPTLYDDPEEAREITASYASIKEELAALYDEWEALADHVAAGES